MVSTEMKNVASSTLISCASLRQSRPKKLLDQVRDAIRLKHYSYRTEQTYVGWIRRYILVHDKQPSKGHGK
ncbi:MAG: phage integrase N-terminal SAM-like domain-containing protein [Leptolyngbyaceae bacterium]|nr:phage integrase N-terminal SAM-like domain-containing protein [Leptolyngbyaceae bacterium]